MSNVWAYNFECDKPMAEVIATLNEQGSWKWIWRDSDTFGHYTSSVPYKGVRVRIFDIDGYYSDGPTYTAELKTDEECEVEKTLIDRVLLELLGKLDAQNLTEGETYY